MGAIVDTDGWINQVRAVSHSAVTAARLEASGLNAHANMLRSSLPVASAGKVDGPADSAFRSSPPSPHPRGGAGFERGGDLGRGLSDSAPDQRVARALVGVADSVQLGEIDDDESRRLGPRCGLITMTASTY
jgi:hypothetical protein